MNHTPTPDKACPFLMFQPRLKKFICRINDTKPEICKEFLCKGGDSQ